MGHAPLTIDRHEVLESFEGDDEMFAELVRLFFEQCPVLRGAIAEAVRRRDGAALVGPTHTLKGSLGVFLVESAVTAARNLEQIGRSGDLVGVETAYAALDIELDRVCTALAVYLRP